MILRKRKTYTCRYIIIFITVLTRFAVDLITPGESGPPLMFPKPLFPRWKPFESLNFGSDYMTVQFEYTGNVSRFC